MVKDFRFKTFEEYLKDLEGDLAWKERGIE